MTIPNQLLAAATAANHHLVELLVDGIGGVQPHLTSSMVTGNTNPLVKQVNMSRTSSNLVKLVWECMRQLALKGMDCVCVPVRSIHCWWHAILQELTLLLTLQMRIIWMNIQGVNRHFFLHTFWTSSITFWSVSLSKRTSSLTRSIP